MNSINIAACIVAFLLGVVLFTLANEIILKLPNNENIFKGKPKSFEKFSPRCLFIQILGGVFGVLMVWQFDVSLEAVTVFLFFALLTIITFIDADTMEIPFVLNVCILVLGVISIFTRGGFSLTGGDLSLVSRLIGMICVSLPDSAGHSGWLWRRRYQAHVCSGILPWMEGYCHSILYRTHHWWMSGCGTSCKA